MASTLWNSYPAPVLDATANIASGAKAYFYSGGTSTPLTVYQDAARTVPHASPVVAGSNGLFAPIFLPYVTYRVRVTTSAGLLIFEADNIANPEPPNAGTGIVVSQQMVFNTGDPIWRLTSTPIEGWVRANGRTIGPSGSGATERANADCEALFKYLWANLGDSEATVSGGRGASSAADWAANKTIVVRSLYAVSGTDDGGTGTPTNALQRSTTCSATNGNADITVASAAGLARNMWVRIDGVLAGTITAISGTTVTLSAVYAGATGAGKAVRASVFADAMTVGVAAGSLVNTHTVAEMPAHDHTITDPAGVTGLGGAGASGFGAGANDVLSAAAALDIGSAGQGLPFSIVQPTVLGVWYLKL
jgi:hypothetical protein